MGCSISDSRWKRICACRGDRFVVFDDFLYRFPDSGRQVFIKDLLLELFEEDIKNLRELISNSTNIDINKAKLEKFLNNYLKHTFPDVEHVQL